MRSDLTQQQENLFYTDYKRFSWLFEVDVGSTGVIDYYWSTKEKTWNGNDYTYKVKSFSPLKLQAGYPELGMLPENRIKIILSFQDNTADSSSGYYASEFEGATVTIRLIGKSSLQLVEEEAEEEDAEFDTTEEEAELLSWTFRVKSSINIYQEMTWECIDWFSEYLEGDYPNTRYVSDLFPCDIMKNDTYCVPVIFGTAYFPLRWIYILDDDSSAVDSSGGGWNDAYLLGPTGVTYTIDRCKAPVEAGYDKEYESGTYDFIQGTVIGSDDQDYKIVRAIIDDADEDGTNDSNGYWGRRGQEVYDMPFKLSRSDLASMTNPANIVEYLLEAWGVPSNKIDADAQTAAAAVFTARSFSLNIGLWYPMPREKLLCKILAVSGMTLIVRDKVYMKVLTKVSQLTIEKDLVLKKSFSVSRAYTEKQKDSGYIVWQESTAPIGQGIENKSLVAAKSSTDNPSDVTIECEWANSSTNAKKAGKLALQRAIGADKMVRFMSKYKIGTLEPGDVISINPSDYGAEGESYDILINAMTFTKGKGIQFQCTRFRWALDDWSDLSETSVTVLSSDTTNAYRPILQGGRDALATAGDRPNDITGNVYIAGGMLATNDDVESNGGFRATNTKLECYNSAGLAFMDVDYTSGAEYFQVGDYDNDKGFKWDQATGDFELRGTFRTSSGSVKRFELLDSDGEAHFYGDRGDSTIEEIATIGIKSGGGDYVIGYFGSANSTRIAVYGICSGGYAIYGETTNGYGVYGKSTNGIGVDGYTNNASYYGVRGINPAGTGVYGDSTNGYGVYGLSTNSYGGYFTGPNVGPICLYPSTSASAPSHSADKGTLWVTSAGVLYINTDGSTTWAKVGAQ